MHNMDELPWNVFGPVSKPFQSSDSMYLTNNATALYIDGEMQYHTSSIPDGGLNCSTFASSMSKGPLNDSQQATLVEGASHPWQDTSGNGTRVTQTLHAKAMTQVVHNNGLPATINAGETLYAIVDGVVYQIVSGSTGEPTQLSMPVVTSAVGTSNASSMTSNNPMIGQVSLRENGRVVVDGSDSVGVPSGSFTLDGSLLLNQAGLTSYQNNDEVAESSNQMQIIMVPDSFTISESNGSLVVPSVTVCQQQYGQSQFASYEHVTDVMATVIQSRTNDFIGASLGVPSEAEVLELLAQASSTLPSFESSVCRTILADECSNDEEFIHLVSESNGEKAKSNVATAKNSIVPFTGFLDSFVSFVQGNKVETLSTVANSTIIRRPPLPRYIPDPVRRRDDLSETRTVASVSSSCESQDNDAASSVSSTSRSTTSSSADSHQTLSQSKLSKSQSSTAKSIGVMQGTRMETSDMLISRRKVSNGEEFEDDGSEYESRPNSVWKSGNGEKRRIVTTHSNQEARTFAVRGSVRGRPRGSRARNGRDTAPVGTATASSGGGSMANGSCVADECTIPFNPSDAHHYQKGDFVVERKDLFNSTSFPIWKIEPGRLLHKFDPNLQPDGSLVHKSAAVYSSWYGAIRNNFKAVKVKLLDEEDEEDGTQDVVQLLPEYAPVPVDDSLDAEMLMELFTAYVGSVLEKAVDKPLSTAVHKGSEKYYRTSVDIVDGLLEEAKKTVVVQGLWKDSFKVMVEELPYYILLELSACLPTARCCQASIEGVEAATKSMWLYGPCYDRRELAAVNFEIPRADAKETLMGFSSFDLFHTYHALHHYKYHLYKKCLEEVLYLKQNSLKSEKEIISDCLQNRIWIQHLFRDFKNLIQKCIVVNVIDTAQLDDTVPSVDDGQLSASSEPCLLDTEDMTAENVRELPLVTVPFALSLMPDGDLSERLKITPSARALETVTQPDFSLSDEGSGTLFVERFDNQSETSFQSSAPFGQLFE